MTRIGVTGHRSLVATEGLDLAVDEAIGRIAEAFPGPLTLVSPLAEGADQLVVRRAFALGHQRLIVPLPFPETHYLHGFASDDGKAEFLRLVALAEEVVVMPTVATEVEAYHAVGRWVLDYSDVVVAVWDGQTPPSAAGTGAIVEEARSRGLPMAWVNAKQVIAPRHEHAASEPGEVFVTFERF